MRPDHKNCRTGICQQGFVLSGFLVLVLLAVTSWVLAENLLDTYQDKVRLASRQAGYLRQVRDSLTQWYIHHAGAIDRVLAPAGMKLLLPRLGLPLKWDLMAASSN
ncbi:MAG: hypothetical protein KGL58_00670, partial [Pseudomonadota bacterium]|nr:hypothetical protein [Pseudomonadota bacterium]